MNGHVDVVIKTLMAALLSFLGYQIFVNTNRLTTVEAWVVAHDKTDAERRAADEILLKDLTHRIEELEHIQRR
jgi:hypothetical protein